MKSLFHLSKFLILIFLFACEKEAINVKVPKVEPKLVIHSYISPQDTLIVVKISKSTPVFGRTDESFYFYKDVKVHLSDGINSIELEHNELFRDFAFTADPALFPILPGRTYYLTVTTEDGKKVEASCKVPDDAPLIENVVIDSIELYNYYDNVMYYHGLHYNFSFNFKDFPNQKNFYRMAGTSIIKYKSFPNEDLINEQIDNLNFLDQEFIVDMESEGGTIQVSDIRFLYTMGDRNFEPPVKINILLLHIDKHYYEYQRTIREARNDNPFAEPMLIYSNIEGGLGIFCAFNKSSFQFELF